MGGDPPCAAARTPGPDRARPTAPEVVGERGVRTRRDLTREAPPPSLAPVSTDVQRHVKDAVRAARAEVARLSAALTRLERDRARAVAVLAQTEALAARLGVVVSPNDASALPEAPAPQIRSVVLAHLQQCHPAAVPVGELRMAAMRAGIPAGHPKSLPKTLQRLRQAGLVEAAAGGWTITAAGLRRASAVGPG